MNKEATLSPRELAASAGISTDALRHYERCGVLAPPARTRAGYRRYPAGAVAQVARIRRALTIGFSLKELGKVLGERARGGAPCRRVRGVVAARLERIDDEIASLVSLKTALTALLADWDDRLSKTPEKAQARLLDHMPALHTKPPVGP